VLKDCSEDNRTRTDRRAIAYWYRHDEDDNRLKSLMMIKDLELDLDGGDLMLYTSGMTVGVD
jgi:hypothetical protein